MKLPEALYLILLIPLAGCQRSADELPTQSTPPLQGIFGYHGGSQTLVFAHRGGPGDGYPENAIVTFDHTLELTGAFMEVDPRYTKDGIMVLFHDDTLERCSNGIGKVSDITYAELKKLKLLDKAGKVTSYTVPTLEEALRWARHKSILLLDRKDVSVEERVKAIQQQDAFTCAMVSAYSYDEAKRVYELDPRVMMQVFMPDMSAFKRFEETGVPWGNIIASISKVPLTSEHRVLIEKIHDKGAKVVVASYGMLDHPYLAGEISREAFESGYQELFDAGVDIIQCDLPIEVRKIIEAQNR
ncbi:MAG: glycerophosphodiester phosphodiesterase family protein [Verrucomicrobiae bacterium]|nr:glycerophosphodiester phosphodiesterase family protein [Verrucomicrobiae bacterium]